MNQAIDTTELTRLSPPLENGLNDEQVAIRAQHGKINKVKRKSSKSYFKIFADNLLTVFNFLGLACLIALLSVGANHLGNYAFVVIYTVNITIGIVQEIRAKHAVEKLSIVKAEKIKVVRNGEITELYADEIVLDDVIELLAGNQIPADCVLADGTVETDESLLTGESVTVKKETGDTLYSGSFIVSGSCFARVEKVGEDCYVQTLTKKAKRFKRTHSELLTSSHRIIKMIGVLIVPIAVATALMQLKTTNDVFSIVTATTSVIIGMIPAGMIFLLTLALAYGIVKLSAGNTLVQDMYSLEMLARIDTLCLDKTGTITDGNMSVFAAQPLAHGVDVNAIISSMQIALNDDNPTARALKKYFRSDVVLTPLKTLPFSSVRKYSAVTFEEGSFVLGATEFVLKDGLSQEISKFVRSHAENGRRVVILAKTDKLTDTGDIGAVEPILLIALEDNVRKQAESTIRWFSENDVEIKVISGDDPLTVSKIAERAGVKNADRYISLFGLSDEAVVAAAKVYSVFGRVSPEQKALIIRTLKENGRTVAMTGDGVNDILAMKEADCAISVAAGTAAAKQLSHIVLLNNDFDSLPMVVKEGRRVINNIQQSSSLYLMKTLFTIVFSVISIITLSRYPFSPNMILPLEFFIIGVPSFFLSLQPNDERVKGRFTFEVFSKAIPGAMILVINALLAKYCYVLGFDLGQGLGDSIIVFSLVFGGYVFLLLLCLPLNNYRFYLIAAVTVMIVLCINFCDTSLFGLKLFSFPPIRLMADWQAMVFLLSLVLIDIPIYYAAVVITAKIERHSKLKNKKLF